jgi:hypothetical protein
MSNTRNTPESPDPRDEIRGALISAVCHAHQNIVHEEAHPFLRPMPLDRLVAVLTTSGDDLSRVLAACWLLDNPNRAERLTPYADLLLGPNVRLNFDERLRGTIAFTGPPEIEDGKIPQTRFAYACNMLFGGTPCAAANHLLGVWLDPRTLVTTIEASVDVDATQRPPGRFRKHADPRGWQTNAGLFFKRSERCDLIDAYFQTQPNPPKIGDTNYDGLLFEEVSFGFAPGFPIDCINVLNVSCESQDPRPTFSVTLHTCLEAKFGSSRFRRGLDVDGGMFAATPGIGFTHLRGTKVARFTERQLFGQLIGRQLNYFAPFFLAALMSTLIFGGACYDPA